MGEPSNLFWVDNLELRYYTSYLCRQHVLIEQLLTSGHYAKLWDIMMNRKLFIPLGAYFLRGKTKEEQAIKVECDKC